MIEPNLEHVVPPREPCEELQDQHSWDSGKSIVPLQDRAQASGGTVDTALVVAVAAVVEDVAVAISVAVTFAAVAGRAWVVVELLLLGLAVVAAVDEPGLLVVVPRSDDVLGGQRIVSERQ